MNDWLEFLRNQDIKEKQMILPSLTFTQKSRLTDYNAGSFTIPLRTIRTELNLRSTFFSVIAEGDSVILKGRGYGHGVGLCQEGAMAMAEKDLITNRY